MLKANLQPVSVRELYKQFKQSTNIISSEILEFSGVCDKDVYNPTIPFVSNGKWVIGGRVENRDSEDSRVVFFAQKNRVFIPIEDAPCYELQDPFVTRINDAIIFGGVRVIWEKGRIVNWVTDFYRGRSISELTYFASGPMNMKDIRLVELPDGRIGVFSRPQGQNLWDNYGCIARIGFTIVDSLEEITPEIIEHAPMLTGHFLPEEWGGANQLLVLRNGLIGVIGHIAYRDFSAEGEEIKHYYSSVFAIDPDTRKMTPMKVICSRDCFPSGPAKRLDLQDITFTAGIIRNDNGTAAVYTGLNDCQVGRAVICDPLLEYENF